MMSHRYSLSERLTVVYVMMIFAVTALVLLSCASVFVFALGNFFV